MTKKSKPHPRQSQWRVFERCLALLMRLMHSPAKSQDMLEIVRDMAEEDDEHPDKSALEKRFEEDRRRLKSWFNCDWDYERGEEIYTFKAIDRSLIDLPDRAVRGLAFLQSTFSGDDAPMHEEIEMLTKTITMVIPPKRRRELDHERGLLELQLQPRDQDTISEEVWAAVRQSCGDHRQLEFEYDSPGQEDGQLRLHTVEPYRYFFDSVWGHYYLEAYSIEAKGPYGRIPQEQMQRYRLGRIVNPRPLPKVFRPGNRPIPKYELIYELTSRVARQGVTKHFLNNEVTTRPDGSATVRALSTNLFFDLRTLLHYGPNCRVIGGEKALEQMKALVDQMYQRYHHE